MGRTAKHNWRKLFLEFCQGKYKSVAEFAKKKSLNQNQVRDEFRKLNGSRSKLIEEAAQTTENQQEKQQKTTEKKRRTTEKPSQAWEALRKQFTDWPDEKRQAYLLQLEARLAELADIPFEELTPGEQKEIGQLRRERRAILSDPDPDRQCTAHRHDGQPCGNPAERGKGVCWIHGGAPGVGAPAGNRNGLRHGFYSKIMPDDPELKEIIEEIDAKGPIDIAWEQIVIQYAAIARAQRIMFVRGKDDLTKILKRQKETSGVHSDGWEKEYELQFAWDKQASFLQAQSKAMATLEKLITRYEAMANGEEKLKVAKLKQDMELAKEHLEIERMKAERSGEPGSGNAWADLVAAVGDDDAPE